MKLVLLVNLLVALVAAVLPNQFLTWHSYALYGIQVVTMLPYLLRRAVYVKNLFLPTFFVLVYQLVNFTFGSYLVPREFGWYKDFAAVAVGIEHYRLIVFFLLSSNIVLFLLTDQAFGKLARAEMAQAPRVAGSSSGGAVALAKLIFYCVAFLAVSYFPIYSAFSFQLVLLIAFFTDPSLRGQWYRFGVYLFCLGVLVGVSYQNKREIIMVLFLIVFLEAYEARSIIRFTFRTLAASVTVGILFFALILAASILRGYGDFPAFSIVDAFRYIPTYMTSDVFLDGIVDNLELNYNYGVAITSIDYTLRGLIDYQYGASLGKIFFLPIPRDVIGFKPESTMQIFTEAYAHDLWVREGSLPAIFPSEVFMNFNYFGLIPFAVVWLAINWLFLELHAVKPRSFVACSCIFLVITVLMFARGSGMEQWILYYLVGAPALLLLKVVGNSLRTYVSDDRRWVV